MEAALTTIQTLVSNAMDFITTTPELMVCFVAGLVPIGFMVIRKAKKASRA